MIRLIIAALMLMVGKTMQAQDWNMHWIRTLEGCPTEQLWFKRTFRFSSLPDKAFVEIASGGRFILYVNGRNVTTTIFEPGTHEHENTIVVVRYDVQPFLKNGANTLAVWYSPLSYGSTPAAKAQKQLSAEFFGTAGGKKFDHFTDESWTCQSAFAHTMPNGDEHIDGRYHINGTATPVAFQKRIERLRGYSASSVVRQTTDVRPIRINLIHRCHLWEDTHQRVMLADTVATADSSQQADSTEVGTTADSTPRQKRRLAVGCGLQLEGKVRLTLQRMKPGDELSINGLHYICNGTADEQACRRFTAGPAGYVEIEGFAPFNLDNINGVEAMEVLPPASTYQRPYAEDRNSHQPDETTIFYDDNDLDDDGDDLDDDDNDLDDDSKTEANDN